MPLTGYFNQTAMPVSTFGGQQPTFQSVAERDAWYRANPGGYTVTTPTQQYAAQGVMHDNAANAPAYQSLNPNDPNLLPTDVNGATNRDVMGGGNYGLRSFLNNHPLGVIASMVGLAAGGAAIAGGLGGSAAGSSGLVSGGTPASVTAAGAGGANTTAGGLGIFGNSGAGGMAGVGGGNAGALAASGGISGGAGIGTSLAGASGMGSGSWLDWLGNNAGTIAGLATGLGGSGTKNQTVTNTNAPPAYLQPYLTNAAQGATANYNSGGPQYYPGQTLAPQSQATQSALQGIIARAQAGSPLVSTAQNYVQNGLQQPISSNLGQVSNPYASAVGTSSAANPYASPVGTNQSANPYASAVPTSNAISPYANAVSTSTAANPYANAVGTDTSANPYASSVTAGTQAQNPYASAQNTFGGATNPYLDATFDQALQKAQSGVESQYARAGRNIGASAPVMGDIASNLATQIYAPAYENERNRQLTYQTQLNDIGSGAFENQQGRQLQSGLAGQNIGANSVENSRARQLQSGLSAQGIGANTYDQQQQQALQAQLQGQQIGANSYSQNSSQGLQSALAAQNIGAQGYENSRSQGLQAALAGQGIGANTYDQQQQQALQAQLQGQNIGAQGFENAQQRQLSDVQSQRSYMDSLLGYASPLAAQDYANLAQLQGAGANQDLYNQQTIDDARQRYDYGQNQSNQNLNNYINQLSGLAGNYGTQTTNTPQYQNQWASALGNSMLLQQLQNSIFGTTGGK